VIPHQFTGVWRQESIAVGDGAPDQPCDVFWLQAGQAFADLRLPRRAGVEPEAFSGHTTFDPPALTWHHHLDLTARHEPDVGVVEWRGADLIERGRTVVNGADVPYEEVWRRVPHDGPLAILVLVGEPATAGCHGSIVRVGAHAVVMATTGDALTVRHDVSSGGRWVAAGSLGDGALPPVPVAAPNWRAGQRVELPGFGEWLVCEFEP
jgi:hypothetical protein